MNIESLYDRLEKLAYYSNIPEELAYMITNITPKECAEILRHFREQNEEIERLQQENERLKEQNNDLRKIYRNTYNRLFENGNDELARYFQAQIDDCPTFYVEPIIDYAKEWKDYKSRIEKAIEYIKNNDNFWVALGEDCGKPNDDLDILLNILRGEDK